MDAPYRLISLLVPVYNEHHFLPQILSRIEAVDFAGLEREILLVDDGSTDGSTDVMRAMEREGKPHVRVFYHPQNRGKGAALRTAIEQARGDIIAVQDADLEYDPADYPALLRLLIDGEADVVYGSRLRRKDNKRAFNFSHFWGNWMLTRATNLLYGATITDMETCYKAFRADILKRITIRSDRFDFEPEITAKILKAGLKIREVPISYRGRTWSEGKKISWRDGFAALRALIKYRFRD
jgi:glycosyltransferase involved in cell wall biosynthesis